MRRIPIALILFAMIGLATFSPPPSAAGVDAKSLAAPNATDHLMVDLQRATRDLLADPDPRTSLLLAAAARGIDPDTVRAHAAAAPPASVTPETAFERLATAATAEAVAWPPLPPAVAEALVPLLDAMHHAVTLRTASMAELDDAQRASLRTLDTAYQASRAEEDRTILQDAVAEQGLPPIDTTRQAAAAYVLIDAALRSAPELSLAAAEWPDGGRSDTASTPVGCLDDGFGILIVCGPGDDTLAGVWMLEIDLGGDDRHHTNSGGSGFGVLWPTGAELAAALALDLGGDDHYVGRSQVQGAGATSPGVLVDLEGQDTYDLLEPGWVFAQGAGNLGGVGVLHDAGGSDTYRAPAGRWGGQTAWDTQGFGILGGLGILHDAGGPDRYIGGTMGQAVGDFQAVGLLIDAWGPDTYEAVRWSQGFGDGLGKGLLLDGTGNDHYRLIDAGGPLDGQQGQGAAVGGTGSLMDLSGNDRYEAVWDAQGWGIDGPAWKPVNDLLLLLGQQAGGTALILDLEGHDDYSGSQGCNGCLWQGGSRGTGIDGV